MNKNVKKFSFILEKLETNGMHNEKLYNIWFKENSKKFKKFGIDKKIVIGKKTKNLKEDIENGWVTVIDNFDKFTHEYMELKGINQLEKCELCFDFEKQEFISDIEITTI